MKVQVYKLNAFTQSKDGGNPAGVVLNAEELSNYEMQKLAKSVGFSETAFITCSDRADFKIRFFTPCAEVDLCGHATIASFSLLWQKGIVQAGEYTQETKAGILKIKVEDQTIFMQQAMPRFFEIVPGEELVDCLGMDKEFLSDELPAQAVSTGIKDILVPLKNKQALTKIRPDMEKIEAISRKYDAVGLHVFSFDSGSTTTAVCRNFAPLFGIPEEAATGTSNGALACYLYKNGKIIDYDKEIVIQQGIYMNKPSVIKARLDVLDNSLAGIWVGGEAVLVEQGAYHL